MKNCLCVALILSLTLIQDSLAQRFQRLPATGQSVSLRHSGKEREYRIHVPLVVSDETNPLPLVLLLHGGGGGSEQASRLGMSAIADEHGFVVAYPNGINKHWSDGRNSERFKEQDAKTDDVDFLASVVDHVRKTQQIDQARVYIAGISNGGLMTQRMAIEKSELFAAAASMIATMPKPLSKSFHPERPVSMLFMNGTADPLMKYDGGELVVELFPRLAKTAKSESRGFCISNDAAVKLWRDFNGLSSAIAVETKLPDTNKDDDSHVEKVVWSGGKNGTEVVLYQIIGGGHVVPGSRQYFPERLVGKANADFNGLEAVWKFFARH